MYTFNAFLVQGKKFYEEKNYDKASACLKWAIRAQPENRECYLYKGMSDLAANNLEQARIAFEAYYKYSDSVAEKALAYVYIGFCSSSQQERLDSIVNATVIDSNCHIAWLILAQHYNYLLQHSEMDLGKASRTISNAITFSQNAYLTAPDPITPLYILGTTYLLAAKALSPFLKSHSELMDSISQYFQEALTYIKQADTLKSNQQGYASEHYANGIKEYAGFLKSINMHRLAAECLKLQAKCAVKYSDIAKRSQVKPRPSEQVAATQNGFFKNQILSKPKKAKPARAWNYINRNN